MSYKSTVFNVFIASPNDVAAERNTIRETIHEWNIVNAAPKQIVLLPIGWETHSSPEMGDQPQAIINKRILKDCDLLVGVFWTRVGTSTPKYPSGSVEEIEEHIKSNKPAMLYFSNAPVHPDSVESNQYAELKKFKESCKSRGIFETYIDLNEFKTKFYRQLQIKINTDQYFLSDNKDFDKIVNEPSFSNIPSLSKEAQVLLKAASKDDNAYILRMPHLGGVMIETNGRQFVEENNPRSKAIWESALAELEENNLIADQGYKHESFQLTREGFEIAELINP